MADQNTLSRRGLFMKMGILLNGLVATALAVPIVGFSSVLDYARPSKRVPLVGAARTD